MKTTLLRAALFTVCLASPLVAADESPTSDPTQTTQDQKKLEEAIRARLAEHTLKKGAPATITTPVPADPGATAPAGTPTPAGAVAAAATAAKEDPTLLLPRVEVNQSRITELAIALQEKDIEIARERKNIKATTLDSTLNDSEVAHKLAVIGGSAAEDRSRLAEERVMLLEAERDLIEQVYAARTDVERTELQKQMNTLKTMRRELERAPKDTRGDLVR